MSPFDWTTMLFDATLRCRIAMHAMLEVRRDALPSDVLRERLPHLPRPEARVAELLDQRRDVLAAETEDREHGSTQARSS